MMTWAEFKAKVEALGVKDGDKLWYIDAQCIEEIKAEGDTRGGDGSPMGWAITSS